MTTILHWMFLTFHSLEKNEEERVVDDDGDGVNNLGTWSDNVDIHISWTSNGHNEVDPLEESIHLAMLGTSNRVFMIVTCSF